MRRVRRMCPARHRVRSVDLRYSKPLLPSMRHVCLVTRKHLWTGKPVRSLLTHLPRITGRNHKGRLILYTRCSTFKKWVRNINDVWSEYSIPGVICRIEYDPRRSSFIALIYLRSGLSFYVLHTANTMVGQSVTSYSRFYRRTQDNLRIGDRTPIALLSHGTVIHSLESFTNSGSSYFRSAGSYGVIMKQFFKLRKSLVKFKSGCLRLIPYTHKATVGAVSNKSHRFIKLGKAGRNIWRGFKPNVRGVAMNPIDHPHGGGNGKKSKPSDPMNFACRKLKWRSTGKVFKKKLYLSETRI